MQSPMTKTSWVNLHEYSVCIHILKKTISLPFDVSVIGAGIIGLSLLLVLVLAPRGFSPGAPVFPSPQKPTHPNSNSILEVSPISIL